MRMSRLPLLAALVAAAAAALPAPAGAAEPATIYVSLPRAGANAPTSALVARGVRAALAERTSVTAATPVRLVWLDDARGRRWSAPRVRANVRRAIADPSAVAYVGDLESGATAVAAPLLAAAGLPHLAPVSTADVLTTPAGRGRAGRTPNLVRPLPADRLQGMALARALRSLRVRRIALIDDGAVYGRGLAADLRRALRGTGIRIVRRLRIDRDGRRRPAVVRAVRRAHPQATVFAGQLSSGATPLFRALHAASPDMLLLGGDALAGDGFARSLGARAQSRVRLTTPSAHLSAADARRTGLGRRADPGSVFAFNGMRALLQAVDRAAATPAGATRASVRTALFDGTLQQGLSGPWRFTATGDSTAGTFDLLRLRGGRVSTPVDEVVRALRIVLRRATRATAAQSRDITAVDVTRPADVADTVLDLAAGELTTITEVTRAAAAKLAADQERLEQLDGIVDALRQLEAAFGGETDLTKTRTAEESSVAAVALIEAGRAVLPEELRGLARPDPAAAPPVARPDLWTLGDLRTALDAADAAARAFRDDVDAQSLRLQGLLARQNQAIEAITTTTQGPPPNLPNLR